MNALPTVAPLLANKKSPSSSRNDAATSSGSERKVSSFKVPSLFRSVMRMKRGQSGLSYSADSFAPYIKGSRFKNLRRITSQFFGISPSHPTPVFFNSG